MRPVALTLLVALFLPRVTAAARPTAEQAQSPAAPQQAAPQAAAAPRETVPVSLERIRKGLAQHPTLKLDDGRPHFYVEIYGKSHRTEDFFEGVGFKTGLVPYGTLTHREFLAMVTPQDLYSSAVFPARDQLVVALEFAAIQWLVKKAVQKVKEAKKERERRKIQEELRRVLELLDQAGARSAPR